ncbi:MULTISPECIES: S8 family serine peptidase [unclassified Halobacteriovorax]|uniref:S8 family serine peptidase n=1 Tax=unclassified Halobacteriovorax TaxID=2639665 RepID=UPI003999A895
MKKISILLTLFTLNTALANDPLEKDQWHLKYNAKNKGANIEKAWKILESNYQPVIAIIDAGFDIDHEDLKDSILINKEEIPNNGIDDDNNGYTDDYYGYNANKKNGDLSGDYDFQTKHGTAVAGVIAAKHDNGLGIKGVAKGIKIIPIVKPEPMAKRKDKLPHLIEAMRYAMERGADIISFSARLKVTSPAFKKVLRELNDKGILVIASSGNVGVENSTNRYPGAYAEEFSNIIVVGSNDKNGNRVKSSNYGDQSVHLFAPGDKILTTHLSNTYGPSSGTSFSTPLVAAVAAMVLATHGPQSRWTMRERLIKTSRPLKSLEGLSVSGGIVDAYEALK